MSHLESIDYSLVRMIVWDVAASHIRPCLGKPLPAADVMIKDDRTPVTKIDKAVQRDTAIFLRAAYPQVKVVGEEGYTPAEIRGAIKNNRWVFVADPVDGTSNLRDGKPNVGSMLHLFKDGQCTAAWLCHPGSGDIVQADRLQQTVTLHNMLTAFTTPLRLVSMADPVDAFHVVCGRKLIEALGAAASEISVGGRPISLKSKSPACGNYMRYLMPVESVKGLTLFGEDISQARNIGHISYLTAPLHDHMGGQMMLGLLGGVNADYLGQPYDPLERPDQGLVTALHPALLQVMQNAFGSTLRASMPKVQND